MIANPKVGEFEWVISRINLTQPASDGNPIKRLKITSVIERDDKTLICQMEGGLVVRNNQLYRTKKEAQGVVHAYIDSKIDSLEQVRRSILL